MGSKMLIDAAHPEETRVVVVRNKRIEDFDYESASKKQLRGNIYLAKVTRVEPSLQAAFVDYGGNRHGFLAFSEIHPDYYQIPVADRQALLEEEAEEQIQAEAEAALRDESSPAPPAGEPPPSIDGAIEVELVSAGSDEPLDNGSASAEHVESLPAAADTHAVVSEDLPSEVLEAEELDDESELDDNSQQNPETAEAGEGNDGGERGGRRRRRKGSARPRQDESDNGDAIDSVGSEDALEELPERVRRRRRTYKIQEVIKRRQIILVQVVKEERGNKGAALTTYLSLAGRYTVLMPNTGRGGGISRKIGNASDRKRLRKIAGELEVPDGMGLIIRTAGASRTKAEVKRDYDYLLRLWENVRDLTLKSTAPTLVYEEGNLLKRSIRDLYNKEIDEILVAGDEAYKEAKDFMRMLMPSHAKNVKPYREPEPIFVRFGIERQLSAMFSPYVTLRSGGYIVLNQTEALVSIDVNSGKATREHNIEDTALKTNLEAAEEIARQLRLRDLAGLIVIDFIDMDERRNNRAVERKLKECLRNDRARIQVGRISHFGLMEMSRQRLRAGMLEGTTTPCSMCMGTGIVRSTESVSLDVLRSMEDVLLTDGASNFVATAPVEVALYILNQKRHILRDIEERYGITITVNADERLHGGNFRIEKTAGVIRPPRPVAAQMDATHLGEEETLASEPEAEEETESMAAPEIESEPEGDGDGRRRRRRRRRRRGGERGENGDIARSADSSAAETGAETLDEDATVDGAPQLALETDESSLSQGTARKGRRRGRRGGRRARERGQPREIPVAQAPQQDEWGHEPFEVVDTTYQHDEPMSEGLAPIPAGDDPSSNGRNDKGAMEAEYPAYMEQPASQAAPTPMPEKKREWDTPSESGTDQAAGAGAHEPEPEPVATRRGWWQRRIGG